MPPKTKYLAHYPLSWIHQHGQRYPHGKPPDLSPHKHHMQYNHPLLKLSFLSPCHSMSQDILKYNLQVLYYPIGCKCILFKYLLHCSTRL